VKRPQTGDVEQRSAPPEAAPTINGNTLCGVIPYGVESRDFGGWSEVIAPGAFAQADRSELVATLQHDLARVLGRHPGTVEVEERADGMAWQVDLPGGPLGQDVKEAVNRGDLRATSWRMRVGKDHWEGTKRIVDEVRSWLDVALVANPSYPSAAAEIRSAPEGREGDTVKVEDRSTEGTPPAGGTGQLRVEQRTGGGDASTPESRVLDAMRGVSPGEMRDLTHATATEVEPDDLRTVLLDKLREASVMLRTGLATVTTDKRTIHWPTLDSDATAAWLNELEDIPESDPGFDEFEVSVKNLKALVRASAEALEDSDPDLLRLVLDHLNMILSDKLDNDLLNGSDAKGIVGLLGLSGVQTFASPATLTDWDPLIKASWLLAEANVPGPYVTLMHPRVAASLSLLKEQTGSNVNLIRPEGVPPIFITNKLPLTATPFKSSVLVYAPAQSLVVWRRTATVEVDRSEEFSKDAVLVRGKLRVGFATRFPQSVVKITAVPSPVIA
jgi:HK97 family phage major capsid protein